VMLQAAGLTYEIGCLLMTVCLSCSSLTCVSGLLLGATSSCCCLTHTSKQGPSLLLPRYGRAQRHATHSRVSLQAWVA
jgi:hypothetical protein